MNLLYFKILILFTITKPNTYLSKSYDRLNQIKKANCKDWIKLYSGISNCQKLCSKIY